MEQDPRDLPATADLLGRLGDQRGWDPETHRRALVLARPSPASSDWHRFLYRMGLGIGTALMLAGVIDLVAFNWSELSRFPRLFLAWGVFSATTLLAITRQPGTLAHQLACTACAVLGGMSLALIGQTWQTGADAWTLFAWWAAVALPFCVSARFAPLWALWTLWVDVAVCTWWAQAWPSLPIPGLTALCAALAVGYGTLVAWEEGRGATLWLKRTWMVGCMTCAIAAVVAGCIAESEAFVWLVSLGGVCLAGGVVALYSLHRPDTFAVACALMLSIVALTGAPLRQLIELRTEPALMLLGLGTAVLVESGLALLHLRGLRQLEVAR